MLVVLALTLIGTVLVFAGMPMAGTWSALVAGLVAATLTLLMAAAFSHKERTGH
ncbi:MAG TPA: hypothetical protein VF997_18160 [Polyangia bacterium]